MKIAVVGTGYVGLSNAMLLSQHNEVVALDIDEQKISSIIHIGYYYHSKKYNKTPLKIDKNNVKLNP